MCQESSSLGRSKTLEKAFFAKNRELQQNTRVRSNSGLDLQQKSRMLVIFQLLVRLGKHHTHFLVQYIGAYSKFSCRAHEG
jgi:hypothetical protein